MRLYRKRASDFELLAETEPLPGARLRYRIIARHYRDLADREEQADKARLADRIERLRLQRQQLQRQQTAAQTTSAARSDDQFFLIAAE